MKDNHPITKAVWTWPEAYMYLYNHFAQFRRDFELGPHHDKAILHITADKSYKLFINGTYVCRGPARGYQSHWPFDSVDIKPFLREGHNWVSVEAYNPGLSTFQYLHMTKAGLLCAAEGKELKEAWNASKWEYRRSPAHAKETARLSLQIDFQEHVDFAKDDRRWITSPKPPKNWQPKLFDPNHGHNIDVHNFGTPPHNSVEERGIPMMREWVRSPKRVIRTATGQSGLGYATAKNVSWFWYRESVQIADFEDGAKTKVRVTDDSLTLEIPATGEGNYRAFFIDIGDFAAANLIVEAKGAVGGEILDFQYDQSAEDRNARTLKPGEGCLAAMSSRLRLAPGTNAHEFYQYLGFQHLTLIARDLTKPLKVTISLRCVGYPFTFKGEFSSSDETLNGIREACVRTQQLCSFDAYVDTPWREQAQWWGDARVQARNTFYMDGDARLLKRGIRSIAGQKGPQGLTYGHAPTSAGYCLLPDFSLTWILTVWDYYFQTGDISLFVEQWPRIEEVLAYFRSPAAVGKLGLLQYDPRFWLFMDWSSLPQKTYPCFLNLWYLVTLNHVVKMLEIAKVKTASVDYRKLTTEMTKRVVKHFQDGKTGLLRPALDEQGKQTGEASVHDQTMALMLSLAPKSKQAMIDQVLLPYLKGEKIAGPVASAFWSFYVLETMGECGYSAEVIDFIRRGWGPMLATGTTWEGFDSMVVSGTSNCHAWTSHPAVHLVNILCGIRQIAARWEEISFAPVFVPGIDHAQARVPSPMGDITAKWARKDGVIRGELKLPARVKARIEIPGEEARTQTGGSFRFETKG